MSQQDLGAQLRMDAADLYKEETFTDQKIGQIRRLTPVDADGNRDESRPVRYAGQTQVMTPAGALPISFELDGNNLAECAEKFAEEAEKALEETMEQLRKMQQEQENRIQVPGREGPGGGMPGGGGGMPGGGIKL